MYEAGQDFAVSGPQGSWGARSGSWNELTNMKTHVDSEKYATSGVLNGFDKARLMYILGSSIGLERFDRGEYPKEIMSWGSLGSGRYESGLGFIPAWGPGDQIGLSLLGPSNGCF